MLLEVYFRGYLMPSMPNSKIYITPPPRPPLLHLDQPGPTLRSPRGELETKDLEQKVFRILFY
jgi:hypothetical protein